MPHNVYFKGKPNTDAHRKSASLWPHHKNDNKNEMWYVNTIVRCELLVPDQGWVLRADWLFSGILTICSSWRVSGQALLHILVWLSVQELLVSSSLLNCSVRIHPHWLKPFSYHNNLTFPGIWLTYELLKVHSIRRIEELFKSKLKAGFSPYKIIMWW